MTTTTTTTTTATSTAATAAQAAAETEEATASTPHHRDAQGRPDYGAAAARTEELYRDHGRLVGGLCRALLRDPAEGEDAAQQVFLAAHRALLNGTSPREPAAWLAAIARNECWGRIRTRMRQPLPTAAVESEQSLSDPLAEAIRNADLAAMWSAIAALPRQQRDALLLREFGGLSYGELAGALAVSGSAVESLLFRARQGVRTRVQAAYAGVTGGIWIESLTRLAGGVGAGMAPVAAKVAVVGVGAAVATGGAVLTPRMLDHVQSRHTVARHVHAGKHLRPATTPGAATARSSAEPVHPIFVARSQAARRQAPAAPAPTHAQTGEHGRDGTSSDDAASPGSGGTSDDTADDRSAGETGSRHENSPGDGKLAVGSSGDPSSGDDGVSAGDDRVSSGDARASSGDGHDSSGGSDSSGSDGSPSGGGGDGDGGEPSDGGSSGSGDGGVPAPVPNPVVTVTVAPVEPLPVGG